MDNLDEFTKGLSALAKIVLDVVDNDDKFSSSTKAMLNLLKLKAAGDKFMDKIGIDVNDELDKVYEEQFNTIITYSKILTNAINEIVGEE